MKSTFTIGDIHGGYKGLTQILERAPVRNGDTLIFIGDYVDGWSGNVAVMNLLLELQKNYFCIFLKGNHDKWLQEWLDHGFADPVWLDHGGQITKDNYEAEGDALKESHLQFLKAMPLYYIDAEERLFVHAGFTAKNGPAEEPDPAVLYIDRSLWQKAYSVKDKKTTSLFYPKRLTLFKEIYIGHTPTIRYEEDKPIIAGPVINIDTGAAFTGRITIMNIDTKEYWQSDPLPELYPEEQGRNKE